MVDPYPDNWTWSDGPVPAAPCVLVDVDGIIADGWHRQHFLQDGKRDWKNFFASADGDSPIDGSVALTHSFAADTAVVLLTARPHSLHTITVDWITEHGYRWDLLILRNRSDGALSSPKFKRRSVEEVRAHGFTPQLAIDDAQHNIDMFRSEGIPSLYIHSGYYG